MIILPKFTVLEKSMKLGLNRFFIFSGLALILLSNASCQKDELTPNVKIVENVGKIATVQMQMYTLLDQLRNGFDESILPYGIKKQLVDSNVNEHSKTYLIDFGKGALCGDYITRKGLFTYRHVTDQSKNIDSIICDLNYSNFGISTDTGTLYISGNYNIIKLSPITDEVNSSLSIWNDLSLVVNSDLWVGVKRILSEPTKISSVDGFQFDGGQFLVMIREAYSKLHTIDAQISRCTKLVNAANFPETGKIICKTWSLSSNSEQIDVTIDFDPLNDGSQDKVAKGSYNHVEWFFKIQ